MQIEKDYIDRLIQLAEEVGGWESELESAPAQFISKLNYLLGYISALKVVGRVKDKEKGATPERRL